MPNHHRIALDANVESHTAWQTDQRRRTPHYAWQLYCYYCRTWGRADHVCPERKRSRVREPY